MYISFFFFFLQACCLFPPPVWSCIQKTRAVCLVHNQIPNAQWTLVELTNKWTNETAPLCLSRGIPIQWYTAASSLPAFKSQLLNFQEFSKPVGLLDSLKSAILRVLVPRALAHATGQDIFCPKSWFISTSLLSSSKSKYKHWQCHGDLSIKYERLKILNVHYTVTFLLGILGVFLS